jgi:hypothetical protein
VPPGGVCANPGGPGGVGVADSVPVGGDVGGLLAGGDVGGLLVGADPVGGAELLTVTGTEEDVLVVGDCFGFEVRFALVVGRAERVA